jgi:hypothetical protein
MRLSNNHYKMRFNSSIVTVLLAALLLCGISTAHAQKSDVKDKGRGEGMGRGQGIGNGQGESAAQGGEATVETTANVNVSLTTGSGRISVSGWDRKEVRAQAQDSDTKVQLRRTGGTDAANPAVSLEILALNKSEDGEPDEDSCNADTDVIVNVPRGATVYLKTENGDIGVDGVAVIHIETADGRIEARRISKTIDVASVSGNISLEDSSGRARLNSINGMIEVTDLRPLDSSDFLKIKTVSGDALLNGISPARVEATTISGELRLIGPLTRGGIYDFTTTAGDVDILLPPNSSFQLNAKISESGEIITEFPLKYKGTTSPISLLQAGRLQGTYGAGEAQINVVSFNGTLRLRKQ